MRYGHHSVEDLGNFTQGKSRHFGFMRHREAFTRMDGAPPPALKECITSVIFYTGVVTSVLTGEKMSFL